MWATVHQYSERDTLMLVYNDFLNDILKGPTHLHFYCQCQRIISQIINGDIVHMHNGRNDRDSRRNLRSQHIKVERVIEIVQRIFTPSTLLSIYEESLKEKKAKELAAEKESKGHNKPGESVSAAFQRNMELEPYIIRRVQFTCPDMHVSKNHDIIYSFPPHFPRTFLSFSESPYLSFPFTVRKGRDLCRGYFVGLV